MTVAEPPRGRAPTEEEIVSSWVELMFRDLGFDDDAAVALADDGVDWHDARALILAGCAHEVALRILL